MGRVTPQNCTRIQCRKLNFYVDRKGGQNSKLKDAGEGDTDREVEEALRSVSHHRGHRPLRIWLGLLRIPVAFNHVPLLPFYLGLGGNIEGWVGTAS